jgi:DNA-binding CsgD family transcriptional regulator
MVNEPQRTPKEKGAKKRKEGNRLPLFRDGSPWRSDQFSEENWQRIARVLGLSPSELDVAKCIFNIQTRKATAKLLGVAEATVHAHRRSIYGKTGVHSTAELIQLLWVTKERLHPSR